MNQATARAGANIALVKYWGKRDPQLNLPAAGSISITLAGLETRTTVTPDPTLGSDRFFLDGVEQSPGRVGAMLDLLREMAGETTPCRVDSCNNFPTGAGLASSASGFAALVTAGARAFELEISEDRRSGLARLGSGSAARSIFGGFVEMDAGELEDGSDAVAHPLLAADAWPLEVVVAVTESSSKAVGSRDGMNHTMQTSPYYPAWVETVAADLETARAAIVARDFEALAEVSEHSALKMHASMLAARPGLVYWNPATLACLHAVRALRSGGVGVFFTVDAGPQVKAVCLPGEGERVVDVLRGQPGVHDVMVTGLGAGAGAVA
ncbi:MULTISPECIES: diphosphomevalonate decarboxylase [unclassified Wenzhouxiangella]|uniref:diphosphomevalonate decarboxylase n=1 Tax=unclassified Wenzhouxiangella TaxID=2613841 RepID=UPI000E32AF13|nr:MULTISPECIES: diphosphomevalonate decarboxylase [unclassified Wenzhouxiangella]RFF28781.1 diphosphomevalonate decarboxylase [Wenzhouxiangella sp. 15181]RFP67815.1 diphosphomevalonate decarboxylase [Wenzhouxiangella sp. 15190]